jgi:hypothetical protein
MMMILLALVPQPLVFSSIGAGGARGRTTAGWLVLLLLRAPASLSSLEKQSPDRSTGATWP